MAGGPFGFSALMLGRRHICTMQMCYDEDSSSYIVTKPYYHLPTQKTSSGNIMHTIGVFFIAWCKIQTPTLLTYVGEDPLFLEILAFL